MKVEVLTLCDAATDSHGKLNVLGSFDTILAPQAPVTHPAGSIAVRVRFDRIEEGPHAIRLSFADEDGKYVLPPMDGSVTVRFRPEDTTTVANLILNMQQVKLERFGEYSIDLSIDGRQEGSIPLYVRQIRPPAEQQLPAQEAGGGKT